MPSDDEFEVDSDDSEEDDEETIDQAEREGEEESRDAELLELKELEDMPLDELMAKYSANPKMMPNDEADAEKSANEDSEGLSGSSDSEMEFEEDYKGDEPTDRMKEGLGLESLLDDSLGAQDAATSKLSDAAAIAESFQPKGNTLESTQVMARL